MTICKNWFTIWFKGLCFLIDLRPNRALNSVKEGYFTRKKDENRVIFVLCTPSGARTLDPNIKSVVLYQLS